MPFVYRRTIRFADTDAAGVVFFPNYLAICHEAYEESLAADGIELKSFFGKHGVVVPVAKSQAEYLRPLTCGDKISVTLTPAPLGGDGYAIDYDLHRLGRGRVDRRHRPVRRPRSARDGEGRPDRRLGRQPGRDAGQRDDPHHPGAEGAWGEAGRRGPL